MLWNPFTQFTAARVGYNIKTEFRNEFPSDFNPSVIYSSYRPDQLVGTTDLQGRYVYRLDSNPSYYVNPRSYCLNWYERDPGLPVSFRRRRPCPRTWTQAMRDPNFVPCNFAFYQPVYGPEDFYPDFNPPCKFVFAFSSYKILREDH